LQMVKLIALASSVALASGLAANSNTVAALMDHYTDAGNSTGAGPNGPGNEGLNTKIFQAHADHMINHEGLNTTAPTAAPTFAIGHHNSTTDVTHNGDVEGHGHNEDDNSESMEAALDGNNATHATSNYEGDGFTKHGEYVNGANVEISAAPTKAPTVPPTTNWADQQCINGAYNVPLGWEGPCAGSDYCKLCKCSAECDHHEGNGDTNFPCAHWGQAELTVEGPDASHPHRKAESEICGGGKAGGSTCKDTTCLFQNTTGIGSQPATPDERRVIQVLHKLAASCTSEDDCSQTATETGHHCTTTWDEATEQSSCRCTCTNEHMPNWHSYSTWHKTTSNGAEPKTTHMSYPTGHYGPQSVHLHHETVAYPTLHPTRAPTPLYNQPFASTIDSGEWSVCGNWDNVDNSQHFCPTTCSSISASGSSTVAASQTIDNLFIDGSVIVTAALTIVEVGAAQKESTCCANLEDQFGDVGVFSYTATGCAGF